MQLRVVSKFVADAVHQLRSIDVNPLYISTDPYIYEKFEYKLLTSFRSLQQLTLREIRSYMKGTDDFSIVDYISQCNSLMGLSFHWCSPPDLRCLEKIPQTLTTLTRLVINAMPDSNYLSYFEGKNFARLTNLKELEISANQFSLDSLTCMTGLKKLHLRFWNCEHRKLDPPNDILTRLTSFSAEAFGEIITPKMTNLQELKLKQIANWTHIAAPNLTRLIFKSMKVGDINYNFHKLKHLKLEDVIFGDDIVLSFPNLEVLKVIGITENGDFTGCVNLRNLVLRDPTAGLELKLPQSMTDVAIDDFNCSIELLTTIGQLQHLTRLDILRSVPGSESMSIFAKISSLQTLTIEYADTLNLPFMESLTQFTQLKVLDLTHKQYLKRHDYDTAVPIILELSQKLPCTKILHGFHDHKPPPRHVHDSTVCDCDRCHYYSADCGCDRCHYSEDSDGYYDWTKVQKEEEEIRHLYMPEKVKKLWYW